MHRAEETIHAPGLQAIVREGIHLAVAKDEGFYALNDVTRARLGCRLGATLLVVWLDDYQDHLFAL